MIIIKESLIKIFDGIRQLKSAFPQKEFTIDGRLVGDIGEILAANYYDIVLYDKLVPIHDGETSDGRKVQIKATFKKSLTFSKIPDYYLGIQIKEDGSFTEIYNGPSNYIVNKYGHRKNFGKTINSFSISILKDISDSIPSNERIPGREFTR